MTTSTHVTTNRIDMMPVWTQPPWPDSSASVCDLPHWNLKVGSKSCWSIRGPAAQAYENIRGRIKSCMEEWSYDLYEGADESSTPHSIDCLMVGRRPATARPYIIISCSQESFCKKAMAAIKGTSWWSDFMEVYPGFGGFILLPFAPRRMADPTDAGQAIWVYSSDTHMSLYGAPIFFTTNILGPGHPCRSQQASFGGIVYVDDMPFGLTVAHPLTDSAYNNCHQRDAQPPHTVFYMDDSENDSASSTCSILPSIKLASQSIDTFHRPDATISQPLQGSARLVGQIFRRSDGTASDEVDWALILLDMAWEPFQKLFHQTGPPQYRPDDLTVQLDSFSFNRSHLQSSAIVGYRVAECHTGDVTVVNIANGRSGCSKGVLGTEKSLVWLHGSRRYLTLHSINLEEELSIGDCGKRIIDKQGNWFGHLVAGTPSTKLAYLASATQIVSDLEKTTGLTLTASSGPRTQDCVWYTTRLKRGDVKSPSRLQVMMLLAASRMGSEKMIRLLFEHGSDVASLRQSLDEAIQVAISHDQVTILETLMEYVANIDVRKPWDKRALRLAVKHGCDNMVRVLLERNTPSNNQSPIRVSALHMAVKYGHANVVQSLLEYGVEVNVQGAWGSAPTHVAAEHGYGSVMQLLLSHGAEVNAETASGNSALHLASMNNHESVERLLLDRGANANALDWSGFSALQLAVENGHESMLQLLLGHESDINLLRMRINEAFWIALSCGHKRIVQLLQAHANAVPQLSEVSTVISRAQLDSDSSIRTLPYQISEDVSNMALEPIFEESDEHELYSLPRSYSLGSIRVISPTNHNPLV